MSRRRSVMSLAAVVILLLVATGIWTGKAFPRIDPAERELATATRADAEAQCDCASASTHRAYLRCVGRTGWFAFVPAMDPGPGSRTGGLAKLNF